MWQTVTKMTRCTQAGARVDYLRCLKSRELFFLQWSVDSKSWLRKEEALDYYTSLNYKVLQGANTALLFLNCGLHLVWVPELCPQEFIPRLRIPVPP